MAEAKAKAEAEVSGFGEEAGSKPKRIHRINSSEDDPPLNLRKVDDNDDFNEDDSNNDQSDRQLHQCSLLLILLHSLLAPLQLCRKTVLLIAAVLLRL